MRYRIVNLKDIICTDPVWARCGKLLPYHIEDTIDGYFAISFESLEKAKECCQEWNDDAAADELSEDNI